MRIETTWIVIFLKTKTRDFLMEETEDTKKGYTLNVFQVKPISIGLNFVFQLKLQSKQVKFNVIHTPLLWPTSNVIKTVVVWVV